MLLLKVSFLVGIKNSSIGGRIDGHFSKVDVKLIKYLISDSKNLCVTFLKGGEAEKRGYKFIRRREKFQN